LNTNLSNPLVSVLCLCYNQKSFVKEAIDSVLNQTYRPVQLIILDDGSTDGSADEIARCIVAKPEIFFIRHQENMGYTKSLNKAWSHAKGEFIIDLAADDILFPNRIEEGVADFKNRSPQFGLQFSDAELIDARGDLMGKHSDKYPHASIPQGDIYKEIIQRYFICPPTMMFRKSVLDRMGGYDDSLAFEDFDFLIRASREYFFCYSSKPLVKRRLVKNSMSEKQFERGNQQRTSTLIVCKKIQKLNRNRGEEKALKRRVRYEFLLSLRMFDIGLAIEFLKLYFRLSSPKTMLT